ncbi:MAG: SDR family NAD(P)-dependent oxidoreductase [Planctomycetes bacterium]|nr:SDR family NAD(P)-dependent oxidoreductase [Planctomycetota bacterium]
MKKAIIVGASSGIGRELAKILAGKGYTVGLAARREDVLRSIQGELQSTTYIKAIDIRNCGDTLKGLTGLITEMGGVDLVIISAGIGFINPELDLDKELETVATNVQGFVTVANIVFRHFVRQGAGHLVGISSIAAIRGGAEAPAYNASKAFISNYLQGLRQKAVKSKLAITVTDIQPGFVDTDMAKGEGIFWVAPARKVAAQIYRAIERKRPHAFVTKRWRLVAWLLKIMPDFLYHRI